MGIQITIRNVPCEVRDELAARAARAGRSMQEYLREELVNLAARPSLDDWIARVRTRKQLKKRNVAAAEILGHRNAERP